MVDTERCHVTHPSSRSYRIVQSVTEQHSTAHSAIDIGCQGYMLSLLSHLFESAISASSKSTHSPFLYSPFLSLVSLGRQDGTAHQVCNNSMHSTALHSTLLHSTSLYCIPLHSTPLHCTVCTLLHCMYYTALYFTALHYTPLHCIILRTSCHFFHYI